jgi:hypothetical protein
LKVSTGFQAPFWDHALVQFFQIAYQFVDNSVSGRSFKEDKKIISKDTKHSSMRKLKEIGEEIKLQPGFMKSMRLFFREENKVF